VWGEEAQGVVTPVVAQATLDQVRVVHELMYRHQLHSCHTQSQQVLDHRRVGEAGVGATLLLRDVRMKLREALHVSLIDEALVVGDVQHPVTGPVEERVDHDPEHHSAGRVLVIAGALVTEVVAEQRLAPVDVAVGGLGVRIQQQFVGIAAQPGIGIVGSVDAVAVALAGVDLGQVAMPDVRIDLCEFHPGLVAVGIEKAELHALGHLAEQGEVRTPAVISGTQRIGRTGPDLHISYSNSSGTLATNGRAAGSPRSTQIRARRTTIQRSQG